MQKRGEELSIFFLINLMLFIVIIIPPIYKIIEIQNSHLVETRFLAKDIAGSMGALYASPNDLLFFYTENKFPFTITFEKNKVTVSDGINEQAALFIEDKNIFLSYKTIEPFSVQSGRKEQGSLFIPLAIAKQNDRAEPFLAIKTSTVVDG